MKENSGQTKSVGIWIRVSTDAQAEGDSPKHHEERAREYAKWNNWTVTEVYDLAGVSGKTVMEHPETKRMLGDIKSGRISGLIFSKLARLARNTKELLEFSDLFRTAGADMISLQEKIDTSTPAGRLFYTMIAALSQWEREEITDRLRASLKVRAKLGKRLGGAAPFGYKWNGNNLEIDPAEAPIRKLMYEFFAEEKRRKSVATRLNALGYRTRNGSKFADTTVFRLLCDPSAKGIYRSNYTYGHHTKGKALLKPESEWVITKIPAIVSEELWNRCNRIIEARNSHRLGPKPVHLFAGLLQCGCGGKMYVFVRSPKYVCPKCHNKIPIEDMESIFREELEQFFVSKDRVAEHLTSANRHLTETRERLAAHNHQIEKVRGEMEKVYKLYQSDSVTPQAFGKLYRPLEEQEKALMAELPRIQGEVDALEIRQISASDVISEATQLHRLWPQFNVTEKRRIIESLVEKITVTNDEINVTYWASPLCEELTKQQRNLPRASKTVWYWTGHPASGRLPRRKR